MVRAAAAGVALAAAAGGSAPLARTPPMGWMSWEVFKCRGIDEELYVTQTDLLVSGGYLAAGYDTIHIDDCWEQRNRTPGGELAPNPARFPKGMAWLGEYMHSRGVKFGIYTDEGERTCKGYPASGGHEAIDARTFASWGVDYLKVDGCHTKGWSERYHAMGDALVGSGRDIVYSCSWPAYLGSNETEKPFADMIAAHCNLWRNWHDLECSWASLAAIVGHWGDYGGWMARWAGPGHWNDPDMLLVGNACLSDDEARTQMALWSISAAPLIMGNDLRHVPESARGILLNPEAIAVDQDPLGIMGYRVSSKGTTEVWARNLSGGAVAVGLYNKDGPAPAPAAAAQCVAALNASEGGYLKACGYLASGNITYFAGLSADEASRACCMQPSCAGFSLSADGDGYYMRNTDCGFTKNAKYRGYNKPGFHLPTAGTVNITVQFADLGFPGAVHVRDIWLRRDLGTFNDSYTVAVPLHGTAFLRLTAR